MASRIKKIEIIELFGFLHHEISLNESGITLIHGPNGCGKTTVLKLISNLFSWNLTEVLQVYFSKCLISFQDNTILEIARGTQQDSLFESISPSKSDPPLWIRITLTKNGQKLEQLKIKASNQKKNKSPSYIEHKYPFLHRVGPREWFDDRKKSYVSHDYILLKYGSTLEIQVEKPEWLSSRINKKNLHFIQTQRLLKVDPYSPHRRSRSPLTVTEVIQLYSDELCSIISNKLVDFATESQSKSRSFPDRLLSMQANPSTAESEIRQSYAETESKIQSLMNVGLINQEQTIVLPEKKLESTELKVLSLYIKDTMSSLEIFDDLQRKIETYISIISSKLRNKKFSISRKDGFVFTPTQDRANHPVPLSPTQLSSGEQHEIVLFYELIFKSDNNSFFLIDEPEISLHVDWQRQFLTDILRITELGKCYFLIATHSPQIIGHRRDLAQSLDGGILNEDQAPNIDISPEIISRSNRVPDFERGNSND